MEHNQFTAVFNGNAALPPTFFPQIEPQKQELLEKRLDPSLSQQNASTLNSSTSLGSEKTLSNSGTQSSVHPQSFPSAPSLTVATLHVPIAPILSKSAPAHGSSLPSPHSTHSSPSSSSPISLHSSILSSPTPFVNISGSVSPTPFTSLLQVQKESSEFHDSFSKDMEEESLSDDDEKEKEKKGLVKAFKPVENKGKKRKRNFTKEEDYKIVQGHEKGWDWDDIIRNGNLERTTSQVRDRYRRLTNKREKSEKSSDKPADKSPPKSPNLSSISLTSWNSGFPSDASSLQLFLSSSQPKISQSKRPIEGLEKEDNTRKEIEQPELIQSRNEVQRLSEELRTKSESIEIMEKTIGKQEKRIQELDVETKKRDEEFKNAMNEASQKYRLALCEILSKQAQKDKQEARRRLMENRASLGQIVYERRGDHFEEVFQDGYKFNELHAQLDTIGKQREDTEKLKKQLKKGMSSKVLPPEIQEQEEIYKLRLLNLKKQEQEMQEKLDALEVEKILHLREIKRVADEDKSRFNKYPILRDRYLLLLLLGKGGFSEVFKAFDLIEARTVAIKIHQLNPQWPDLKKHNYSKHAVREYNIQKSLIHRKVVRLYDVFEIDENSFCTVLEYCDGSDLDGYIKVNKSLPEREAKSIVLQILSGLKYLNEQKRPIIHYDLKPGNILFHNGEIKITDFGLSKIMDEDADATELTSQGAGTYWYLPPECFELGMSPPKISSKVDVWSTGVIFYQMLYGKKPFGNDLSQARILMDDVISKANDVEFPAKPPVSKETKEFIRVCLTHRQEKRPDVLTLFKVDFIRFLKVSDKDKKDKDDKKEKDDRKKEKYDSDKGEKKDSL